MSLVPLESVSLKCPGCKGQLGTLTPAGIVDIPEGWYYGEDGDCIPGLPLVFEGHAFMALATVGSCHRCEERFWSLDLYLHESEDQRGIADPFSSDREWVSSFVVSDVEQVWTAHVFDTELGRAYEHFIGPMPVPAGAVTHGRNGVSACGGGAFWHHARCTFDGIAPRLLQAMNEILRAAR